MDLSLDFPIEARRVFYEVQNEYKCKRIYKQLFLFSQAAF